MKKYEIAANSYDEAASIAKQYGITVVKNATRAYSNRDKFQDINVFANNLASKYHLTNKPGSGFMIVLEKGNPDSRKKPFKLWLAKNKGNLKKTRVFEVRLASDQSLLGHFNTRKEAIEFAKAKMPDYQETLVCKCVYYVDSAHSTVFKLEYAPSVSCKTGRYLVFGVE